MASMSKPPHIVLFPFMSKGHTIPLLHLTRLLITRGVVVTIFTTQANHPFITQSLNGTDVSITDLPFPENIPEIPSGIESTDKLPSMSLFVPFVNGLKQMQPHFERALENIHSQVKVSCIVSDGFLHWTLKSASRFSIPRLTYYGMSNYAMVASSVSVGNGLLSPDRSPDEPFALPGFPWIKLARNDFPDSSMHDARGPYSDFLSDVVKATRSSYGLVVNSFYELEPLFADYYHLHEQPKTWNIGPLCLAQQNPKPDPDLKLKWIHWLDQKLVQNRPVLYVAFGSQAELSPVQLRELAFGLEESNVCFLWVVGKSGLELPWSDEFENRVKERGLIVKEWVDQKEILEHKIVEGFLSHSGWNSVLEGICVGVPILAWPMLAEQGLNAKMVVEELKVGLRVKTVTGSAKGFVTGQSLRDSFIQLMEGEKRKELKEKAKELAEAARHAVADGGSSWNALNLLIEKVHMQNEIKQSSS